MKIALLGATGRTGVSLVQSLLAQGHEVRVLVRDATRVGSAASEVTVVTGDSTDPAALDLLLEGSDVVVSALGPTAKEGDLHTRTADALLTVMPQHNIRRFVGVSGAGVDAPGDTKGLRDRAISLMIHKFGGGVAADKTSEYARYADSDLDWTLVRPPRLLDGPATGRYEHDAHRPGRSSIRRADLASFITDVVENDRYLRQAPFVWNS